MLITICIIVKDEEEKLEKCLRSLKNIPADVVVVDTGSTDQTKKVAEKYTKHVYDFTWCNDFAKAKNYAVSKAKTPFVLILDSDEWIEEADWNKVEQIIKERMNQVGRIQRKNEYIQSGQKRENVEWINRLFCKDLFCYEGRIHEQITAKTGERYTAYRLPIVIGHSGYNLTMEEKKKKAERNIRLLQEELSSLLQANQAHLKNREEQISYLYYQLGKSYYMKEEPQKACDYLAKGLEYDVDEKAEYVIDMVETYGYALLDCKREQEALALEGVYDVFCGEADFLFLMGLIYMKNARFAEAVLEFEKATKCRECHMTGNNSYLACYNIGVIYECLGQIKEAMEYYKKCEEYQPAKDRITLLQKK